MIVRDATAGDIFAAMRALDARARAEQLATSFAADIDGVAAQLAAASPHAIKHYALCTSDGAPAALLGAWLVYPRVAELHAVMTPQFDAIKLPFWRFALRTFIPTVLLPTARVARVCLPADRIATIDLLHRIGFRAVGFALPLGNAGEQFVDLAWLNPFAPAMVDADAAALASPAFLMEGENSREEVAHV